jgi:hypothetical protein
MRLRIPDDIAHEPVRPQGLAGLGNIRGIDVDNRGRGQRRPGVISETVLQSLVKRMRPRP